jgi:hypothetical protein
MTFSLRRLPLLTNYINDFHRRPSVVVLGVLVEHCYAWARRRLRADDLLWLGAWRRKLVVSERCGGETFLVLEGFFRYFHWFSSCMLGWMNWMARGANTVLRVLTVELGCDAGLLMVRY